MLCRRLLLGLCLSILGCGNVETTPAKPIAVIQDDFAKGYLPWDLEKFALYKDFDPVFSDESNENKYWKLKREQDQQSIVIKGHSPSRLTEIRFEMQNNDGRGMSEGFRRLISSAKHLFPDPGQSFDDLWIWARLKESTELPAIRDYAGIECEIASLGKIVHLYLRPVRTKAKLGQ